MNYKEMLDKFQELETKLKRLEIENRHLKERVTKLEGDHWFSKPIGPSFTPGTLPPQTWPPMWWSATSNTNSQFGDH
jgi:hypothetical protein